MTNTDVVKKLIGNVQPYGASHIDEQRFENLKAMCELVGDLMEEIKDAAIGSTFIFVVVTVWSLVISALDGLVCL